MIGPGFPDSHEEAEFLVGQVAGIKPGDPTLPYWPHSQIIALCQLVTNLERRVVELETKRKPGRPPKVATVAGDVTADLIAHG